MYPSLPPNKRNPKTPQGWTFRESNSVTSEGVVTCGWAVFGRWLVEGVWRWSQQGASNQPPSPGSQWPPHLSPCIWPCPTARNSVKTKVRSLALLLSNLHWHPTSLRKSQSLHKTRSMNPGGSDSLPVASLTSSPTLFLIHWFQPLSLPSLGLCTCSSACQE